MTDNDVTDEDLQVVYAWLNDGYGEDTPIRRVLRAYLPAPPATLADELREWFNLHHMEHMDSFSALVKRAEAVEKELSATHSENERVCAALATVTDERNNAWDRLADLQDVRDDRDEARAEVTYWKEYALDRQREVERLTQERLDRNPETKARVDEALGNLNQAEAVTINTDTGTPASKTIAEELMDPDSYGEDTDGQYVVFDQKRMMRIVKRVEALEEMVK